MHGSMTLGKEPKIYDRMSADLPINSVVAETVVKDEAGDYIKVLRSIRDDPLAGMLSRDQIDTAMFEAGRLWQKYYEHSEIGGISAIDPTKEAVDGGRIPEPITDRQIEAIRELGNADKELGEYGASIIRDVLGRHQLGRRLRECLDTLAHLWNFA